MSQSDTRPYLQILSRPYTVEEDGVFNSEPYDFKFELDSFQKHAINAIKREENVLVTAHTGLEKRFQLSLLSADF